MSKDDVYASVHRDPLDAVAAAEAVAKQPLTWERVATSSGKRSTMKGTEYVIQEAAYSRPPSPMRVDKVEMTMAPLNVRAATFFEDGRPLGAPDTTKPFSKSWTRPKDRPGPMEIECEIEDTAGKKSRHHILTVD